MALFYLGPTLSSQGQQGGGDIEPVRMINASKEPLLAHFRFRSIGPASMGGRIDDLAIFENDPSIIYVGYATGGVFKSENGGITFTPIFEEYTTASIGDLAVHPANSDILYVGTGEANNRQTSSFGDGMYKTTDGGKTFAHIGLKETQTIARIVIDPRNPETVYVAALGHLFGPNKDRGVFKTTDGGKTWTNVKFIDENTGFTDLVMDPSNSNILYAASYQRRRSGCCFNGGGPGSGLWKTTDAGRTWTKLTGNGLPPGTYGRIALDVSRSNPNVVYAQIEAGQENQPMPQRGGGRGGGGGGGQYDWCNNAGPNKGFGGGRGGQQEEEQSNQPRTPPTLDAARGGVFRSDNKGAGWLHVSNCNSRPMYFSQLRVDPSNDKVVYVAGLPVAKSLDGGKTFATLNEGGGYASPGHVDQHAIWIDPKNPKHVVIGNDGGLNVSWDQGKSWDFINTMATALPYWVSADMRRPYYVYVGLQDNGSWGGPSATRNNNGILNSDWFGIGGGDGFQTAVDPTDYNIVYTESQNGNTNRYDLRKPGSVSIRPRAPGGGRGTPPTGPEANEGAEAGRTPAQQAQQQQTQQQQPQQQAQQQGGGRGGPPNVLNARPGDQYRFNWNTPFALSPHNPSMVWLGGNRLFKSMNRGDTWTASEDLTKQVDRNRVPMMGIAGDRTMLSKNDGVTAYSTIVSLSESPVVPGVVWAGTDDGNVQVSRDFGETFSEVGKSMPGLPANHYYWISRIDASHFDPATAYVSVDGHRDDDLRPYLYVTRDYGKTWQSIVSNLPQFGNIQVVREDPRNPDLLYVGTEFGLYISMDRGKSWQKFMNNLPTARVDDILIHPRDNDLIVATHARGVWILDDITPLQQMSSAVAALGAELFDIRPAVAYVTDRQSDQYTGGQRHFVGENPPRGASINYYLKGAATGDVRVTISDLGGRTLRTINGPKAAGINRVMWNLTAQPPEGRGGGGGRGGGRGGGGGQPVEPGTYVVALEVNGQRFSRSVTVLEDIWLSQK